MTGTILTRPMSSIQPEWNGAVWVGSLDIAQVADPATPPTLDLEGAWGHSSARLLIRRGMTVLGLVTLPLTGGFVSVERLRAEIAALDPVEDQPVPTDLPFISVVICTRDRAEMLRTALSSVLELDYPRFEIVVVDNAAATTDTSDLVLREFSDERIRLIAEPVPGLSSARNAGLRAANGTIVAFTDDDVVVDRSWLQGIATGFAQGDDVACVSGLVPSGELRTAVQVFFDERVSWSKNTSTRVFRLDAPPADLPMFPFSVGEFGTGANFALRTSTALEMGGFDTAFGVGTRTGGGEDLDIFTRVLFAGHALVVEPSAIVWHRHRSDLGALRAQAAGYGIGLGAWLTKVALDGPMRRSAARRAPRALQRLMSKGGGASPAETPSTENKAMVRAISRVGWFELLCVARGPGRYLRQRWDGAGLPGATPSRRISGWGLLSVAAGIVGLLASSMVLPTPIQTALTGAFVLLGPGSAIRTSIPMPRSTSLVAVPALGLAVVIAASAIMAAAGAWNPALSLLVLSIATIAGGLSRWVRPGRRLVVVPE
jgi:GT2 family glycosyltransferase